MTWYPSKVDLWLAVLLWAMPIAVVGSWVAALISGSNDDLVGPVVATVTIVGILFGLVYPIRYGLDDKHLMVRFGLVRTRIPLADITTVKPTRNPLGVSRIANIRPLISDNAAA